MYRNSNDTLCKRWWRSQWHIGRGRWGSGKRCRPQQHDSGGNGGDDARWVKCRWRRGSRRAKGETEEKEPTNKEGLLIAPAGTACGGGGGGGAGGGGGGTNGSAGSRGRALPESRGRCGRELMLPVSAREVPVVRYVRPHLRQLHLVEEVAAQVAGPALQDHCDGGDGGAGTRLGFNARCWRRRRWGGQWMPMFLPNGGAGGSYGGGGRWRCR